MEIFVTKYIKNGHQSWVWKNVRGGNVSTPFYSKFSKYGGESTKTKLITIFLLWNLWNKMNNVPGTFFFGGGCVLLAVDVKVK